MSPKQPSTTPSPLAAHKARILSKGYMCTEIKRGNQTISIYKAMLSFPVKNVAIYVNPN